MHLLMIIMAFLFAYLTRWIGVKLIKPQPQRALFLFVCPALLLLMTSLAVLCMGPLGQMLGWTASWISYLPALLFSGCTVILLIKLSYQTWLSCRNVYSYPQEMINEKVVRIIETNFPYSAVIGFWRPELVVSRGLLNLLDEEHLKAVLAHEQAHYQYRDTFCFFWLGWLRDCTCWLPYTEELWQELLLYREIRADQTAAQQIDPLTLAESLVIVAQQVNEPIFFNPAVAALNDNLCSSRLMTRIDALLTQTQASSVNSWGWYWLIIACLPLFSIPLHS